jgi:hypothetical protein
MAKRTKKLREEPSELDDAETAARERFDSMSDRNEELCNDADIEKECVELYAEIEKGFSDQWERANKQLDYLDIYNCELGPNQFYSGNSKIFIPIVHDAIKARKVRHTNQIFPPSGKNVDVITSENKPEALQALLEFYIRKTKMRSVVLPQLLKNGDLEGQYNLYMSWTKNERHVTWRVEKKQTVDEDQDIEIEDAPYWDIEEETIEHEYPDIEVLPDADVLVLPFTARSVEEAIATGGSATVIRRWSKATIRQKIRDEEIDQERGEELIENLGGKYAPGRPDKKKKNIDAAGIQTDSGGKKFALVYETWTMLNIEGERRICRIRFGNEKLVLSAKRNPYWCDHVPLISGAQDPTDGSFKGRSEIKNIETIQYAANDAINEAMDSAAYALLPIVMTDPVKNPRVGSMILSVAAVWETNPNDTKFAQFPPLWKDGFDIVAACKSQIFQTLGINPAMIPQSERKGGKSPNQAQVAQEQQVDILTVADVVTGLEEMVLTPVLRWCVYLDHQFRKEPLTLRQFGLVGKQMNMQIIPPVQMDRRYEVKWFGVEAARSAQQMQLQMAGINVVRGIPPQQYEGFKLNLAPVLQQFMENLFGPRIAGEVFQDLRKQLSLEAQFENTLLEAGFQVPTSPMDNDQEHLKSHMEAMQASETGDHSGAFREHMMRHQMAMQLKRQAAIQQQSGQALGQPGSPGGAAPGVAGQRPGANGAGPRGGQGPAGMIHQDRLSDASAMPRR